MDPMSTEHTPLLPRTKNLRKPTPLNWSQISIILLVQLCEPIACLSINPYINELISTLEIVGGDDRKVGYYAGIIESLFFAVEALTVLQWSRLSDYIGRKPVMLIGLFGLSVSMLCFGLSRTFWALVMSRCLCGLLNGNVGVMKSALSELTDSTNRAEGFALMPVIWATGSTLGPLLGGSLSKPAEQFPNVFGGFFRGLFWREYPYFLPCAVVSGFIFIFSVITLVFFKETVPKKYRSASGDSSMFKPKDEPVPLQQLLVFPVIMSVANYMSLALIHICLTALIPLFFAMPIEIGGLGFEPAVIGYIMGCYGALTGIFQAFFFSRVIRYFGERGLFLNGMLSFPPMFALLPLTSYYAKQYGVTTCVWLCIIAMVPLMISMDLAYGAIFMFITASAPNKSSLGATHGLSQTTASVGRAIGPALATALFSFSVEENILGGYGVYAILFLLSCLGILLAVQLPNELWPEAEDDKSDEFLHH